METINEYTGRRIREIRHAKGWTQEKLASEAGLSDYTVLSHLENARRSPRMDTLLLIAVALNTPMGAFLPDVDEAKGMVQ